MTTTTRRAPPARGTAVALVAWLVTAVFYFLQYALRSAPAVMMPELSTALGLSTAGVASLLGFFYYGYSPGYLVAGAAVDRFGARRVVPLGAAAMGVGALLFATGQPTAAGLGRFLQGLGGAVAFIGAVYLVTRGFPASKAATFVGATQMFGMAGGSAGQFVVGPIIASGTSWDHLWFAMGAAALVMAALLFVLTPAEATGGSSGSVIGTAARSMGRVFRNPQSILCGIIAGLLFIPTTIFDMVWGVRYLQEAHGFEYGEAVLRSSMVPLGWIVGCPLLGALSDRIGRRKPVLLGGAAVLLVCLAWILFGVPGVLPPYVVGFVAGVGSGAAMLTTTVTKEANPPELAGTSVGVTNFINFTFSALLGPVFAQALSNAAGEAAMTLEHYQFAFQPMLYGVVLAMILTAFLRETGPTAAR